MPEGITKESPGGNLPPGPLPIRLETRETGTKVKRWFQRHPEYQLHFTPTSGSWLNQVERFFAEITEKRIRRGAFRSVAALEAAIMEYLAKHNENPRPFVWTANADLILERVKKVCERISNSGH